MCMVVDVRLVRWTLYCADVHCLCIAPQPHSLLFQCGGITYVEDSGIIANCAVQLKAQALNYAVVNKKPTIRWGRRKAMHAALISNVADILCAQNFNKTLTQHHARLRYTLGETTPSDALSSAVFRTSIYEYRKQIVTSYPVWL